ncbi:MAG TPA: hypothetical protein VNY05_44800 [Candidatus Acidoferrales bacterium]|nr:hypothetical protein [Candidatus Acidoferrales bacterium]
MDRYPGQLQVIALTVQDSRLAALKRSQFFSGEGVPRNAFIDTQGRIVDYHVGTYVAHEDDLMQKVDRWLKP